MPGLRRFSKLSRKYVSAAKLAAGTRARRSIFARKIQRVWRRRRLSRFNRRRISAKPEVKNYRVVESRDMYASGMRMDDYNIITAHQAIFPITQGVGESQRTGSRITCCSLKLRFTLNNVNIVNDVATGRISTAQPQYVRMVMFYDKKDPNTTPTPYANGDFFEQSTGSGYTGFTNSIADTLMPINTNRYHVYKQKFFKIGFQSLMMYGGAGGGQYVGATTAGDTNGWLSNNDFKSFVGKTVDLTKYLPKTWSFNDGQTGNNLMKGVYILFITTGAFYGNPSPDICYTNHLWYSMNLKYVDP